MKKYLLFIGALVGWFSVLLQYILMLQNRVASVLETTIRFFSFFTILTNTLVAIYFTAVLFTGKNNRKFFFEKPGTLTAITVYITVVCLVYQFVLRQIWEPTGLQMMVDELLHTIMPIYVVLFWYLYEEKSVIAWKQIPKWLVYPGVYLTYILIRGEFSGFYPYPFINVTDLGIQRVLVNSGGLVLVFLTLSFIFVWIGRIIDKK